MRSTLRGFLALGTTLLVSGLLASACGSDDGGGGTSTGGKDGGGGSGGSTGGSGGSGGNTGGSAGGGGCPAAPTTPGEAQCDTCQDDTHLDCACDAEITACTEDADCSSIWDCVVADPACTEFSVDCAIAVHQCIAATPAGKAKYLAVEKCGYCTYCATACETAEYCSALDNPPDGGTTDGGSDATSDAPTGDSASDAPTGDSATD